MVPQFETLGHIPLMIHWPGVAGGGVCDALTTAVDLHATLAEVFDVSPQHQTHGHSLAPLLRGEATSVRDYAVGGVFGNWVQVTDGRLEVRPRAGGQQLPAVDVEQPLEHDADPRAGHHRAADARRACVAGPHAGQRRSPSSASRSRPAMRCRSG